MNEIVKSKAFGDLEIIYEEGKAWFPATKCASILGYKNPEKAVRDHCKKSSERIVHHPQSKSKEKYLNIKYIPEGDLYRLIVNSKLPAAEKFENWVFDEILPAIRKNGYYSAPKKTPAKINIKNGALVNRERPPLPLASYEKCKLSTYANRKYIQKRLNNVKVWTLHDAVGETGILTNEIYNCCYRNILSSKMWKSLNAAEIMALKWENPYPCEIVATSRLVILYEAGINMLCELYGIDRLYNGVEIERINTKAIAIET